MKIATFLPKPTEPGMKYTAEVSVAEIPRGKMIKPELVDTILDKEAILAMHEQQLDEAAQTAFFFTDDPNCDPNALVEEEYEVPVINLSKLDGLLLRALKAGRRDQIATSFAMMADSFKSLPMPSSEIEMACKLSDLGVALTDHMTQCDNETHEFRFTTPTLSMVVASLHSFAGIIYKRGVDREAAELADLGVAAEKQ